MIHSTWECRYSERRHWQEQKRAHAHSQFTLQVHRRASRHLIWNHAMECTDGRRWSPPGVVEPSVHVPLPWIQQELAGVVVDAHPQVSCCAQINDLQSATRWGRVGGKEGGERGNEGAELGEGEMTRTATKMTSVFISPPHPSTLPSTHPPSLSSAYLTLSPLRCL